MKLKGTTFGETLGPAMEITDQAEADDYFEQLVVHYMERFSGTRLTMDRHEAEKVVRENLGYYPGYYSPETQARVNRLFKTTHPIFGDKAPTPEEAFEAGKRLAEEELKKEKRGGNTDDGN